MAHRDSIRLNGTSYVVLGLVRYLGTATPYGLKRFMAASTENFWPVPHTTCYEEPPRLAKAGYLSEDQEQGGRRRKRYQLTEKGRAALEAWVSNPDARPMQVHDEAVLKVFLGADPIAVFAPRREWHEAKLRELEGYLETITAVLAAPPNAAVDRKAVDGTRRSLVAGVAFHKMHLELLERTLANPDAYP